MIKISIRKVLFIMMCAELLILYYSQLEVRESQRQVVYRDQPSHKKHHPKPVETEPKMTLKKAS